MPMDRSRRGFSLIELMIVITMIGILGASATAGFQRISARSQASAFWSDVRVFGEAFGRHAQEHGSFPVAPGTAGLVPSGMADYLRRSNWQKPTPLGGQYEWIDRDSVTGFARPLNGAVRVTGCTWTMDQLRRLDGWFDDGNLATGNLTVGDAGTSVYFVIERSSP